MKLFIVRHGETEENFNGIIQGHIPGILTEMGKEQSKKLAERLKDEKFDLILSSDLARASDTAKEIIKFHPNVAFELTTDLREIYQGKLQGKNKNDIEGWKNSENRGKIALKAGAESIDELVKRAKKFLDFLKKNNPEKNILLISHGGFNLAILVNLLGKNWIEMMKENFPKNASLTILEFDEEFNVELKLMNCIRHLEK